MTLGSARARNGSQGRAFPAQQAGSNGNAGKIEKAADGGGRGVVRETRRALGVEPQGRFAADGPVDERKAARGIRSHQAQGIAEEEGPAALTPSSPAPELLRPAGIGFRNRFAGGKHASPGNDQDAPADARARQ